METLYLRADLPEHIARAAQLLRTGALVAFPTETVYGLGANALSRTAAERIFAAKQRPSWDPLIVHVAGPEAICEVADVPEDMAERVDALAKAFWPGPMTLLLPRRPTVPDAVTAGRSLVGVRVPAHPAAQALLRAAALPLAAPSANRFGHTSPTTAAHVLDDLGGRIAAVLDGGACAVGVESTVLDPAPTPMILYRAGAVTTEGLWRATGVKAQRFVEQPTSAAAPEALPSPGVGIRHYAPDAPLWLAGGDEDALWRTVAAVAARSAPVGVLLPRDWRRPLGEDPALKTNVVVEPWGQWSDEDVLASELFSALRALEKRGVAAMVCPLPPSGSGLRDAMRDRLEKAAKPK